MSIDVKDFDCKALNDDLREVQGDVTRTGHCGQCFIAVAMSGKNSTIEGYGRGSEHPLHGHNTRQ